MHKKKIIIAAGGTGGHMFPAQALALELKESGYEVLFIGAKLDTNKYFQRELFSYRSISSSTISRGALTRHIAAVISLTKGCIQSWKIINQFKPDLVVGFGSFHTAPVLVGTVLLRKPFVLFESNAWPGKVNRFFSRFAQVSAVQFSRTMSHLSGKSKQVTVPFFQKKEDMTYSKEESLAYYGLKSDLPTALVFGGSQGAQSINSSVLEVMKEASLEGLSLQVIHFTGTKEPADSFAAAYNEIGIKCCVKPFEEKMVHAWNSADIAICRAGAATISELVRFEIPAILIPFPKASEDHQKVNAEELKSLNAALYLTEDVLHKDSLFAALKELISEKQLSNMKDALKEFKRSSQKESLMDIVKELLTN